MWSHSRHHLFPAPDTRRQGTNFSPAPEAGADSTHKRNAPGEGVGEGETLHTTIVSGNGDGGGETKSSPSIMELFSTANTSIAAVAVAAAAAAAAQQQAAAAAASSAVSSSSSPAADERSNDDGVGGASAAAGAGAGVPQQQRRRLPARANAWGNVKSFKNHSSSKTASLSTSTDIGGGGKASARSPAGGVERHGYLSFSEVQVDEEDETADKDNDKGDSSSTATSAVRSAAASSHGSVDRFGRELLARRLKKRARATKIFLAVMQGNGLRVRKYHRRGNGWAHRVVKYDPVLPGLRWRTSKWWGAGGGQIPLGDVLDVERRGKVVWIKCLHLGTIALEASLETDAVIFYLAMDSLLDARCGVSNSSIGSREVASHLSGVPAMA
ncbi:unnamed protein product [Pylaiella littoralis]